MFKHLPTVLTYVGLALITFATLWALNGCAEASSPVKRPVETAFLPGSVVLYITRASEEAMCSGVLVGAHTIATARHCTRGAERIVVYEPTSAKFALAIHVVEDAEQDRAEIETHMLFDTHATVAQTLDQRPVRVQGFGCSDGARLAQRSALFYSGGEHPRQIVWAGRACRGDSGGGVWNADGRLAAIMTETGYLYDRGRRINIMVGELL